MALNNIIYEWEVIFMRCLVCSEESDMNKKCACNRWDEERLLKQKLRLENEELNDFYEDDGDETEDDDDDDETEDEMRERIEDYITRHYQCPTCGYGINDCDCKVIDD
jgi:hypothetical protein